MKLRTKILGGYGLTLVLLILVWVWAVFNLNRIGHSSNAILEENYRSILAAEKMVAAIERQDSSILTLLLGNDEEAVIEFRNNEVEFLRRLSQADDNVTIEGEQAIIDEIETTYLSYLDVTDRLRALRTTDASAATSYYYETVFPTFERVRDATIRLRDLNQDAMVAASERAQQVSSDAIWSTAGVGILAAVVGLAFSLVLSRRLTQPLQAMATATEQIAHGTYDVHVQDQANDELGRLARKINLMSRRLQHFHELNVGHVIAEKQRNEAIIRSISDGIILVDVDYEITAINPKAADIFGAGVEQALGEHLFDITENQALYDHVKRTVEEGETIPLTEDESTLSIAREGQTAYYRFSVTPVNLESDRMVGVVLLLQDITQLKELDRLKSDFVMTASHELRTPLTSIAMSIDLLLEEADEKLSKRENNLLQAAQEDVQRLRALVNDLLDLSKIEAGRVEMEMEPVSADLLIDQAITPLQAQANEQEKTLVWDVTGDAVVAQADPNKITWVLTNLIANALRYTEAGGRIEVAAHRRDNVVYFTVSDDGAGIPFEYQSKIFDKFVQAKDGRSGGGTGLGLAISKEIVKAHGGTIWVNSTPGEGSTFTFTLPAVETAPGAQ